MDNFRAIPVRSCERIYVTYDYFYSVHTGSCRPAIPGLKKALFPDRNFVLNTNTLEFFQNSIVKMLKFRDSTVRMLRADNRNVHLSSQACAHREASFLTGKYGVFKKKSVELFQRGRSPKPHCCRVNGSEWQLSPESR